MLNKLLGSKTIKIQDLMDTLRGIAVSIVQDSFAMVNIKKKSSYRAMFDDIVLDMTSKNSNLRVVLRYVYLLLQQGTDTSTLT